MIAFAAAVTSRETYERCAGHGFRLVAEPDSAILDQPAVGSIYATYNRILERARELEGLEALVLVHQDGEIVDPDFCPKLRRAFADPSVGAVGCVGAIGVRSIAWWEGSVTWASFIHRYPEMGGGDFVSLTWDPDDLPPYAATGEVDTLDGLMIVLSPWAVHNVTFDESLDLKLHGYDFDVCLQVREGGHRVLAENLRVIHHHTLELADDPEPYADAHAKIAEKWDGRMGQVGHAPGDWRTRALRAEAEASVTRAQSRAWQIVIDARLRRHARVMDEMRTSTSLRVTAPLLQAEERRRGAAAQGAGEGATDADGVAPDGSGLIDEVVADETAEAPTTAARLERERRESGVGPLGDQLHTDPPRTRERLAAARYLSNFRSVRRSRR
jgi:hypothetical protein